MWSKEEAQQKRIKFFTEFGKYMRYHSGDWGEKINWMNYNTGVKSIYFKIEADKSGAALCIDIVNKDEGIKDLFYEQFIEFKNLLSNQLTELKWVNPCLNISSLPMARISTEIKGYNLYLEEHWTPLFEFLEKNLLGLHHFWEDARDVFIELEK